VIGLSLYKERGSSTLTPHYEYQAQAWHSVPFALTGVHLVAPSNLQIKFSDLQNSHYEIDKPFNGITDSYHCCKNL